MCVLPEEAQLISPNFYRRPAPLNPHCSPPHRFTRDGRTWELEAEPLDPSSYSCISLAELLQPILAEEARECTKKRGSLEDGDVTKPRRQTTYVLATRRSPCAARCGRLRSSRRRFGRCGIIYQPPAVNTDAIVSKPSRRPRACRPTRKFHGWNPQSYLLLRTSPTQSPYSTLDVTRTFAKDRDVRADDGVYT